MTTIVARHWTKLNDFVGNATEKDFKLWEEHLHINNLNEGEVLCEAVYLSVDPYMRVLGHLIGEQKTMCGEAVSKVIKSRNGKYSVGSLVLAESGWRTHFISKDGKDLRPLPIDLNGLSPSLTLGALGMTGLTAYFGLRLCEPKVGEICVVNGAAGAVGSIVGQMAKAKGLTVIAFAGTEKKCDLLKNEFKFDKVYNYNKISLTEALHQSAPNGVDVFFDNVGGDFFSDMLNQHMAQNGRVCVCGYIADYNETEIKQYPQINRAILRLELSVRGVQVASYVKEYKEALEEMLKMIENNELASKETMYYGFDTMPHAFVGLFKGDNIGKAIVQVSDYPSNLNERKQSSS